MSRVDTIISASATLSDSWFLSDWVLWVLTVLIGLVGLALALRGLFGDRARGRPHCWKCRYEMTGVQSLTCPECGHVNKSRQRLFKTRRYYGRFALGAFLFMLALYCHTGPQVQYRRGVLGEKWWESIVPTTVWIVMLPKLDAERIEFLDRRVWRDEPKLYEPRVGQRFRDGSSIMARFVRNLKTEQTTDCIPAWQAGWLAQAARTKLRSVQSDPKFPDHHARSLFGWIIGVRGQTDVNGVLIDILNDSKEDEGFRARAASMLGEQPDDRPVEEVVAALMAAATDESTLIRTHACIGLAHLGPRARFAAGTLALSIQAAASTEFAEGSVVEGEERPAVCAAMAALIKIDPTDPRPFIPLLYSPDDLLPSEAVHALKLMAQERRRRELKPVGMPIMLKARKLRAPVIEACLAIEAVGGRVGNVPEFDQALREMFADLRSDDDLKRRRTRDRLLEWREDMLPILYWAARQDDITIHEQCAPFVIFLGETAAEVAPPLVKSMLREPARLRLIMSEMVAYVGPPKAALLNVLLDALSADDAAVRDAAATALRAIGASTEEIALIADRLKSGGVEVRLAMVRHLGEMTPQLDEAKILLRRAAEGDEDSAVRAAAADAFHGVVER